MWAKVLFTTLFAAAFVGTIFVFAMVPMVRPKPVRTYRVITTDNRMIDVKADEMRLRDSGMNVCIEFRIKDSTEAVVCNVFAAGIPKE